VFNLYRNDRLTHWKEFRDSLETSDTPLEDVAILWSRAPFVSPYLNPTNPTEWPDPWHLILDGKFDDLAICLGMLYTIKLTHRFIDARCEIHTSTLSGKSSPDYWLIVDGTYVLNYEYKHVIDVNKLENFSSNKIWTADRLQ
jgi:hypothetical protein